MPLYKTITADPDCRALIWKVEETESGLAEGIRLNAHCQERFNGMRSEIHRRAFLSIRHLMAEAGYTDMDLFYDEAGKPHLKDGMHISITHSYHFTGIILSREREVGIDIEKQREKILKVAHRFTPLREYRSLANDDALIRKLTMVWGAKESIYKVMAVRGLNFLNNIYIDDFDMEGAQSSGHAHFKGKRADFSTFFQEFEGFTCAYAIKAPVPN